MPLHALIKKNLLSGAGVSVGKLFLESLCSCFPDLDPNVRDFMRRTPLHWGAVQGLADIVPSSFKDTIKLISMPSSNLAHICTHFSFCKTYLQALNIIHITKNSE
jgi:hypothetical protein